MSNPKWEFVDSEIITFSILASLQRANVYTPDASERLRSQFRQQLRDTLQEIASRYYSSLPVESAEHVKNLRELAARASRGCEDGLQAGHLRLGVAQKALNLYLKYLWCLGRIPTPPHCPFDQLVITQLPRPFRISWTKLDDPKEYQRLVEAAEKSAKGESLSEWELRVFQGAQQAVRLGLSRSRPMG